MRKIAAWGLGASLLVGLGTATAGAGDDVDGASTKSSAWGPTWQWKPFSASASSKEEKPIERKPPPKSQTTEKKPPPAKRDRVVDEAAAGRSREEAALLRRLQACDKLKDIALRSDDKDLLRRAEELEERAQAAYRQRTARLQHSADRFESDEKTIDRFLGAGKSGTKEALSYTVRGTDHSNEAAAKEVKP